MVLEVVRKETKMDTQKRFPSRLSAFFALLLAAIILLPTYSAASPKSKYAADEIIVKFKGDGSRRLSQLSIGTNIKTKRMIPKLDYISLKLPKGIDAEKFIATLKKDPSVEYAGRNHLVRLFLAPNDPIYYYGDEVWGMPQWGLYNDGYNNGYGGKVRADIHAEEAWNVTTGSQNVPIAVIDTGMDYTHPDLASKLWTNPNEIPNNGIDDDQNGYVDDVHGWDFVNGDNDPMDDHMAYVLFDYYRFYHGTLVAGVAAAAGNNYEGIAGVSWGSPVVPLKVVRWDDYGTEDDVAAAIVYAVDLGIKVINISLGMADTPLLKDAVDYAWSHGALCICASGNDNLNAPTYPAAYEHALAVGATNRYDQRAFDSNWGSNYGPWLDVTAPGDYIVSTGPLLYDLGIAMEQYDTESGTSASAPAVSGIAALIWSVHPEWTNQEVAFQIMHTADDIGASGWDQETGWGRVNAYRAVTESILQVSKIGDLKRLPPNTSVKLTGKKLSTSSGSIAGRLYVQEPNRSSGIALAFSGTVPTGLSAGQIIDVMGTVGSVSGWGTVSGERAIIDPIITIKSAGDPPKPIAMNNKTVGGGSLGLQGGVVDRYYAPQSFASGLNNIGLLVRTAGKVTYATYGFFYIDDGSKLKDGSGYTGVRVDCGQLAPPEPGAYAAVTGISSCEVVQGANARRRVLRPRTQSDIKIIKQAP